MLLLVLASASASAQPALERLPNGRPDLGGNWTIAASISDISANIVRVDGKPVAGDERAIPYTPVYAQLRAEAESRMFEEPELHCYMSGVPSHLWRQAYSGAGLVIQHTEEFVVFLHEFQGSRRIVSLTRREHTPADIQLFMGDGLGRFEGDTLVIETRNNNALTWLDTGGNRHSAQLVVTERFVPVDNDRYEYEATFVDPAAYTAPWTIAAPMTRGPTRTPRSSSSPASRATPTICTTPKMSGARRLRHRVRRRSRQCGGPVELANAANRNHLRQQARSH